MVLDLLDQKMDFKNSDLEAFGPENGPELFFIMHIY